jgi:hypothetical protein
MKAVFYMLLPTEFLIPEDVHLKPQELEIDGYSISIFEPEYASINPEYAAQLTEVAMTEIAKNLRPDPKPRLTGVVKADGKQTRVANLIHIEFHKDEFDRRRSGGVGDPPLALIEKIALDFILRLRAVSQANHLKPVHLDSAPSRLEYLTDDNSELPPDPNLFRSYFKSSRSVQTVMLYESVWNRATELLAEFPYQPKSYDTLIQDAFAALPEIGTPILLANSALETLIDFAFQEMLGSVKEPELWAWILDRGDWRKEPSTAEKYDVLLKSLSGKSLKDDHELWEAFQLLRGIRNNFVHDGKSVFGKKEEQVTQSMTRELLSKAIKIIEFVENLLPAEKRRPIPKKEHTSEIIMMILRPDEKNLGALPESPPSHEEQQK